MLGRVIRNHAQEKMIRCRVNLGVVGVRGLMGFLMYMSNISLCQRVQCVFMYDNLIKNTNVSNNMVMKSFVTKFVL